MNFFINPLEGKYDEILKCYIDYFGEEYRDLITQRLENTLSIFIPKFDNNLIRYSMHNARSQKIVTYNQSREILDEYLQTPLMQEYFDYQAKKAVLKDRPQDTETRFELDALELETKMNVIEILDLTNIYDHFKNMGLDSFSRCYNVVYNFVFTNYHSALSFADGKQESFQNFCVCPDYINLSTQMYLHEMMHCVSLDVKKINGVNYQHVGFASTKLNVTDEKYREENWRLPCLFNEVVTELFMKELYKNADKSKIQVGFLQRYESRYLRLFPVLEKFIKNNNEVIKKLYITQDLKGLYDYFGEENMKSLFGLINEFDNISHFHCRPFRKRLAQTIEVPKKEVFKNVFHFARSVDQEILDGNQRLYFKYIRQFELVFAKIQDHLDKNNHDIEEESESDIEL